MRVLSVTFAVTALTAAATPGLAHAQGTGAVLATDPLPQSETQGSATAAVLAGLGLGAAGFLAGGLVGIALTSDCTSDEWCQLEGAFYGAAAGGTLAMAGGVHLGNRRRGNFALDFLTGAVVWGAGIGITLLADDETVTQVAFVTIPIVQIFSTVLVERVVGRHRLRSGALAVRVVPLSNGRAAFAASLAF